MREETPYCERCGAPGYGGMHHIKYRSQGGDDIRENLIRLCMRCHVGAYLALYDLRELVSFVVMREGISAQLLAVIIGVLL